MSKNIISLDGVRYLNSLEHHVFQRAERNTLIKSGQIKEYVSGNLEVKYTKKIKKQIEKAGFDMDFVIQETIKETESVLSEFTIKDNGLIFSFDIGKYGLACCLDPVKDKGGHYIVRMGLFDKYDEDDVIVIVEEKGVYEPPVFETPKWDNEKVIRTTLSNQAQQIVEQYGLDVDVLAKNALPDTLENSYKEFEQLKNTICEYPRYTDPGLIIIELKLSLDRIRHSRGVLCYQKSGKRFYYSWKSRFALNSIYQTNLYITIDAIVLGEDIDCEIDSNQHP